MSSPATAAELEVQPDYDADPASPWRDPAPVPARRRLAYAIAFLAAVLAIDRAVGFAFDQLSERSQYRYSMLYAGKIDADVIVLGDSRGAHSMFAPEMSERLGARVFNLSNNGIGMDLMSIILRDYLDRNRPPKLILLEVTSAEFPPGGTLFIFQPFFARSALLREQFRAQMPDRYWASELLHSYRYNGNESVKFLLYLRSDDQHWISPAARKIPAEILANREIHAETKIDPRQVEAWRQIVAAARAKGVKIVPFIAPFLRGSLGRRDLGQDYERLLSAGIDDAPPILDYSRAIDDDDAFADRGHTNEIGARLLFERMVADGVFAGLR